MKHRQAFYAVVGALSMALGVSLLVIPGAVTIGPIAILLDGIESAGTERVLVGVGIGVAGYLAIALRTPHSSIAISQASNRYDRVFDHPPEAVVAPDQTIAAAELDADIDEAIDAGGDALVALQDCLRVTATTVYADVVGVSYTDATQAIEAGEWCQDPLAAQFLARDQTPPMQDQLRLLLVPERERRRRIERTITAIEHIEYGQ